MALDTTNFTGVLFSLLSSALFWLVIALILVGMGFGFLFIRRAKQLSVPVIEEIPIGRGKLQIKTKKLKGGWFKQNSTFFGLYDYGQEEVFKLKDGRRVYGVSSQDYHDINGRPGLIVTRSSQDPKILAPIQNVKLVNGEILELVAPVELRTSSVDIIKKAEKETADRSQQIVQWLMWGGIIIFSFIAIIMITQMVQKGQTEAKDLILEAGRLNQANLKTICAGFKTAGETIASGVAP
jgi:hypothetical protein